MSRSRTILCGVYSVVAVIALVACWRQNLLFASDRGIGVAEAFVQFWPALFANHATTSISIDMLVFALAASTWMVIEGRRLAIPLAWAYVVLGIFVAISFTFPLFLVARERRLAVLADPASERGPTTVDTVGLALLGAPIVALAVSSVFW
jgi:hypothetical protein